MNDGADHTTGVAAAADATAIVSDGSSTEIAALAWSREAETEEAAENAERANWRWRLRWASLVALVCVMALATGWLSLALYREDFTHSIPNARPATVKSAPQPAPAPAPTKSVPIAAPPTVTALPPAPSAAPASPYATLVGKWVGHERELTVSADGGVEIVIPDFPACPTCSMASMPDATIHVGLTSYNGTADGAPDGRTFFGYVKDSSDARVIPAGLPVEVDVTNASDYNARLSERFCARTGVCPPERTAPGRVLTVTIDGDRVGAMNAGHQLGDQVPFCDKAADKASVCGA
ncbi:hypothetical protein MSM1_07835 [Mycobacterium sp. SM1]|uniref:hypothetical protein n=1 Tax=Mycobacterium sp. SM1 TaxID=2816243 RepID=UPI001BCC9A3C|nr:hypothetical protein [Mycobacterium sp. SM1]MBS4728256.1 hypothetical protein [Mycobacterium sp. SM1]